jgi:hypothetical protein
MMKIEFLKEPTLEFGEYFEHEDSKTGLAEFGPFGKNVSGLHKSEISLGIIGTGDTISGAKDWIKDCGSFIESENLKLIKPPKIDENDYKLFVEEQDTTVIKRLHKILNRDFEGFSRDTRWASEFQLNERWEKELRPADLTPLLKIEDKEDRIKQLVGLFDDEIKRLAKASPAPDIIVVALTEDIETQADSVRLEGNVYLNFRRALKARAMKWGKRRCVPVFRRLLTTWVKESCSAAIPSNGTKTISAKART